MKHDISELYRINGLNGIYSECYIVSNNIPVATNRNERMENGYARRLNARTPNNGIHRIHTSNGLKVVYAIGNYTFFDTEAERNEAKAEANAEAKEKAARRIALEKLAELNTVDLLELVEKLGL